jgi:hypothetical protein
MPLSTLEGVNVLDNFTYMQERTTLDIANVGYYKTELANGVTAELSATNHAGIVHYQYPENTEKHILVDVSHMLPSSGEAQHSQFYGNGFLARSPDGTQYQGYGVYRGGFSSRKWLRRLHNAQHIDRIQVPMRLYSFVLSLTQLLSKYSYSLDNIPIHIGRIAQNFAHPSLQTQNPLSGANIHNMAMRGGSVHCSRSTQL